MLKCFSSLMSSRFISGVTSSLSSAGSASISVSCEAFLSAHFGSNCMEYPSSEYSLLMLIHLDVVEGFSPCSFSANSAIDA